MLDLKNMSDEEFCVVVTPPVTRVTMQVTIDESGNVSLSGKLAEHFSKKPIQIRFNKDGTAIQISCLGTKSDTNDIVFPKSGRKMIPSAKEILKRNRIAFPVVFSSYDMPENEKWRGARQENPISKPSTGSHNIKKK